MKQLEASQNPELAVAEGAVRYFRGVRANTKDPGIAIVAARYEQQFEQDLKRIRANEQPELIPHAA
ncbi:MAG TPA: hypothetical protein VHY22_10275 [Chthoniobacteraceae bacterium]|jgi:hypothetical protein|nr:hypothetical protein [Chthoniobacteraceae bacterium]